MTKIQKLALFLLRVGLGWLYFWAGITKVLNPSFSAAWFLQGAKTFPSFYHWLASPGLLPITNFLNEWGLTFLGLSLILGLFVRWSAPLGIMLMALYYLPILQFPYPDANTFVVDQHFIFAFSLFVLWAFKAGSFWSLSKKLRINN